LRDYKPGCLKVYFVGGIVTFLWLSLADGEDFTGYNTQHSDKAGIKNA
jgi:hypothetical protein